MQNDRRITLNAAAGQFRNSNAPIKPVSMDLWKEKLTVGKLPVDFEEFPIMLLYCIIILHYPLKKDAFIIESHIFLQIVVNIYLWRRWRLTNFVKDSSNDINLYSVIHLLLKFCLLHYPRLLHLEIDPFRFLFYNYNCLVVAFKEDIFILNKNTLSLDPSIVSKSMLLPT